MEIKISNMNKYFKQNHIFFIPNLVFRKGKKIALTGKNGSGKSTLMNIIAGIDLDYSGEVLYDGKKLNSSILKNITMMSQKPYIFKKTVYENIAYPLKIRKFNKKDIEKRVEYFLKALNLEDIKNRKGDVLSGGETQKVSMARSLIIEPDLLLVDEFTSNIDDETIPVMEKLLLDYQKKSKCTMIVITHDRNQVERLSDEEVSLDKIDEK